MTILVLAEHDNSILKDATLAAVTAAGQLGGDVHLLVAGHNAAGVAAEAAKVAGVAKVLLADDAAYADALAENVAPLITGLMASYDAVVAPATTRGKNILPRVAAAQADAAGCFVQTPDGKGGSFRSPASPARFAGYDDTPKSGPPGLGEHTDAVLGELGYSQSEIAALRASKAVA